MIIEPTEDAGGIRRAPLILLCLIATLVFLYLTIGHGMPTQVSITGTAVKTVLMPNNIPVIDPVALQKVSLDRAKQINDATPFIKGYIPPAQPFQFSGNAVDLQRATACLTTAIYYEAGAETPNGQMAVAQVILNRMRHPAFPKSVCGVVFQGAERRTGCQFSFTCDGAMARTPSPAQWSRATSVAQMMLAGAVYAPVGIATHYHTDWVIPAWSAKLDKIRAERTHLFFRWAGFWGTPKAFRGNHSGTEPVITKMSALSPAHSSDIMVATPVLDPAAKGVVQDKTIMGSATQDSFILVVDPALESAILVSIAEQKCGDRPYCKVMVWTDRALAPVDFPVRDQFLASLAFSYLRNQAQGFQKPLWNCAIFPRGDKKQCMRHRLLDMDAITP